MKIVDVLKFQNVNKDVKVVCGNRWLIIEGECFVVYEHVKYQRFPQVVMGTEDEDEAVKWLLGREQKEEKE